jgi:chemotaxis protein methyltransferase CheR
MSAPPCIPDLLLAQLSDVVKEHLGLNFPEDRWVDLVRAMTAAAHELGVRETEAFVRQLVASPLSTKHVQLLAFHLTVGETYFFREKSSLDRRGAALSLSAVVDQ